jgi:hypothetical protein
MTDSKKGYRIWTNKVNGFRCVELHYAADPAKTSDEWKKKAKHGLSQKAWDTEMELSWETYSGEGVYSSEFNKELHIAKEALLASEDNPTLVRGWDFGGNHSCVVVQYIDGQVRVLREYANLGYNTRKIAKDIAEDCKAVYGHHFRYVEVIDPSGLHEGKTSTGLACADVMRELKMNIVPGIQDVSRRVDSVMQFLTSLRGGVPGLLLDPSCKMLIDGFMGGYHYPEKETKNQKRNNPEKNEYSHIHDALQYACTRIDSIGNMEVDVSGGSKGMEGPAFEF